MSKRKEMNAVTAIAGHLNVVESAIERVEEWANVLFCVVKGLGARFVSKKVVKAMEVQKPNKLEKLLDSITWMIDVNSMTSKGKWTTFQLNGDYYPRDIHASLDKAKSAGFSVFYNKQQSSVGVLTEQLQ